MHADKNAVPTARPVPSWALWLGYSGLIPFVALAAAAKWAPAGLHGAALQALAAYGAVIASFLGAIHWGLAASAASASQARPLIWGVTPALVAWLALMLAPPTGLVILAVLLALCLAVDLAQYPTHGLRSWLPLRIHLTAVAAASLLFGAWAA